MEKLREMIEPTLSEVLELGMDEEEALAQAAGQLAAAEALFVRLSMPQVSRPPPA